MIQTKLNKCKTCGEFYKKYSSLDKYCTSCKIKRTDTKYPSIWPAKVKICKICKKEFLPHHQLSNMCSYECRKINKANRDKEYVKNNYEKIMSTRKKKYEISYNICKNAFNSFHKTSKYCSRKCYFENEKWSRIWKWNPCYRNWKYTYSNKDIKKVNYNHNWYKQTEFVKNCKIIKQEILEKYWYVKCQHCNISNSLRRENHHLIFRSEAPRHKNIHNTRNILFVCIKCHNEFHKNNSIRKQYVVDRKLWELFPEYVKKDFYIDL